MMYNTIGELDVKPSNKWEFAKLSLSSKLCSTFRKLCQSLAVMLLFKI
jgi:hypothetical protein